MKSALIVFGIVAFLGLAAPGGHRVAASVDSAEFDAFVRTGLIGSADLSLDGTVVASNEKDTPSYKTNIITCNGEAFNGSKCIGETLVNRTIFEEDTMITYSLRYCDGVYTRKTKPNKGDPGQMTQTENCRGKTQINMRTMKKNVEVERWVKKYVYSRSCFLTYVLTIKISASDIPGKANFELNTLCDSSSQTTTFSTMKKWECSAGKKSSAPVPATCNDIQSTIDKPCEGRFLIELKKSSSRFGRVLLKKQSGWSCNDKDWTFICDGKWTPEGGQFYECDGIKQEYVDMFENDYHSSKNCTGVFGASMFKNPTKGYTLCIGQSTFDEKMTIASHPPPPPPT